MGYVTSAGVARDLINKGNLKIDGEVILDHRAVLNVCNSTLVTVYSDVCQVVDKHPAFLGAKFGL